VSLAILLTYDDAFTSFVPVSLRVVLVACSNGADVVFALDGSGSIGFDNFQRMTQFVGLIVQTLDIDSVTNGPTISRVGLVTFSDSAVLQFNLNRYTTKMGLLQAVNVPYLTGATNMAQTIRFKSNTVCCSLFQIPVFSHSANAED